ANCSSSRTSRARPRSLTTRRLPTPARPGRGRRVGPGQRPIAGSGGGGLDCPPASDAGWAIPGQAATPPQFLREAPLRPFHPKPADINRAWHVIDAEGQVLGKVATEAANLLRGKHKPIWAPHVDTGDHVIVVNAAQLDVSPRKLADKQYHRHSGYPGG